MDGTVNDKVESTLAKYLEFRVFEMFKNRIVAVIKPHCRQDSVEDVYMVFGPGKLPEIGRAVGKSIREFRKATTAVTEELEEKPAKKRREAKIESGSEDKAEADDRGGDGQ